MGNHTDHHHAQPSDTVDIIEELKRKVTLKDEELEQFIYTASHDLKSPLVAISGYVAQLKRDIDKGRFDRLPELASWISEVVQGMNHNINDLVELSRIGRITTPAEQMDIAGLALEIIGFQRQRIEAGGIKIEIEDSIPKISGDPVRIRQMLQILIKNAIHFGCDSEQPRISISGERQAETIMIRIEDNGRGIDPKYHQRIFELFQRLDPSTGGTGIGLTLARKIAEVHHGTIHVESTPGDGANFVISWPVPQHATIAALP